MSREAEARELLGRELSQAEIDAAGMRFPTMLRCLRLIRDWSAGRRPASMAPVFRVPTGTRAGGRDD